MTRAADDPGRRSGRGLPGEAPSPFRPSPYPRRQRGRAWDRAPARRPRSVPVPRAADPTKAGRHRSPSTARSGAAERDRSVRRKAGGRPRGRAGRCGPVSPRNGRLDRLRFNGSETVGYAGGRPECPTAGRPVPRARSASAPCAPAARCRLAVQRCPVEPRVVESLLSRPRPHIRYGSGGPCTAPALRLRGGRRAVPDDAVPPPPPRAPSAGGSPAPHPSRGLARGRSTPAGRGAVRSGRALGRLGSAAPCAAHRRRPAPDGSGRCGPSGPAPARLRGAGPRISPGGAAGPAGRRRALRPGAPRCGRSPGRPGCGS